MSRRTLLVCIHLIEVQMENGLMAPEHAFTSVPSKDVGEEAADTQREQSHCLVLAWLWLSSMLFGL